MSTLTVEELKGYLCALGSWHETWRDYPLRPISLHQIESDPSVEELLRTYLEIFLKSCGAYPSSLQFHRRIAEGFPIQDVVMAIPVFKMSVEELSDSIGISTKTLQRKWTRREKLPRSESDRFYRLIKLLAFAAEVFNNPETARNWMHRAQPSLGNVTPMELLKTEAGAEEVENLLGRIKYGVIS
ncbi:MAG TPA: antitoxin Xre/MbcA/ParS toxin-binding domain-containing protein [Dissulfurispiraceae bacterium]|nr:antitoxin Xre/MbcA/ParS toxin-binding domain-containing protein [Dissulfurispiraceae bacterium]